MQLMINMNKPVSASLKLSYAERSDSLWGSGASSSANFIFPITGWKRCGFRRERDWCCFCIAFEAIELLDVDGISLLGGVLLESEPTVSCIKKFFLLSSHCCVESIAKVQQIFVFFLFFVQYSIQWHHHTETNFNPNKEKERAKETQKTTHKRYEEKERKNGKRNKTKKSLNQICPECYTVRSNFLWYTTTMHFDC